MFANYSVFLKEKIQLTLDVVLFKFQLIGPNMLSFLPGQYMILNVPYNNTFVKRLYSIASCPTINNNEFEIIVKIVQDGVGSNYLDKLNINDKASFSGPAGIFTLKNTAKNKVFLTVGTGIAPIRSILLNALQKSDKTDSELLYYLFWGLTNLQNIYLFKELKELSTLNNHFQFKTCLSRENSLSSINHEEEKYFSIGRITGPLDFLIKNNKQQINNNEYYLCGSRAMVDSIKKYLLDGGVLLENIIAEKY